MLVFLLKCIIYIPNTRSCLCHFHMIQFNLHLVRTEIFYMNRVILTYQLMKTFIYMGVHYKDSEQLDQFLYILSLTGQLRVGLTQQIINRCSDVPQGADNTLMWGFIFRNIRFWCKRMRCIILPYRLQVSYSILGTAHFAFYVLL